MSSLDKTLVSFSTFLKQLIQTFHNLHFTADPHSSNVLTLAKENSHTICCSTGLSIQLETTHQHLLCSISNNGWISKQKYWINSNRLLIDPTTTNVCPAPPHKRHRNSNPLLAQIVLRRTLSTNAPSLHPLPLTKNIKRSKISSYATTN